jgi:hypothetical protein
MQSDYVIERTRLSCRYNIENLDVFKRQLPKGWAGGQGVLFNQTGNLRFPEVEKGSLRLSDNRSRFYRPVDVQVSRSVLVTSNTSDAADYL